MVHVVCMDIFKMIFVGFCGGWCCCCLCSRPSAHNTYGTYRYTCWLVTNNAKCASTILHISLVKLIKPCAVFFCIAWKLSVGNASFATYIDMRLYRRKRDLEWIIRTWHTQTKCKEQSNKNAKNTEEWFQRWLNQECHIKSSEKSSKCAQYNESIFVCFFSPCSGCFLVSSVMNENSTITAIRTKEVRSEWNKRTHLNYSFCMYAYI